MKVSELKILLKDVDPNAYVVVNGNVVNGIEVISGKVYEGYMNDYFRENNKNKHNALVFTKWEELCDGNVEKVRV